MTETVDNVRAIRWRSNKLILLDQRRLPAHEEYVEITTCKQAADAIRQMVVRGAPAIGVTAAYAVVLAAREHIAQSSGGWRHSIDGDLELLVMSRPTAVNLSWAVSRMREALAGFADDDALELLLAEAKAIHEEDIAANRTMGRLGAELLASGTSVLTHCNTGALATGGYGTALGVVRAGFGTHKIRSVFAGETRPWLQGARLTAWELIKEGIPVTLIPDSAAAHLMCEKQVEWVILGADRVAGNGDVANKIGTYSLAVLARQHDVRFMVVAPTSTIDLSASHGGEIEIEQRPEQEVLACGGHRIAPHGAHAFNPVFDITPAYLVDYLVTEKGVVEQPTSVRVQALFKQ